VFFVSRFAAHHNMLSQTFGYPYYSRRRFNEETRKMMYQGRSVTMALLLLVGAPFGAAQDICTSDDNTFTVKVDLFASELGTFMRRINQYHFSTNHNSVKTYLILTHFRTLLLLIFITTRRLF
jgi:hypothetical protein